MKKGFLGIEDDYFGLVFDSYHGFGGYADPMQSIALPPQQSPAPFGYNSPLVEQRHHYDVSYYTGNSYAYGNVAWGDYSYTNLSIDTVDYYSIFGHTSVWHVSANGGYGNWFSAPGYNAANGHYWSNESAGIHSDSWFGSSDTFVFRNIEGDYSHLQIGNLVIDNSHLEIHEGAGHHEDSLFARLDSFAFRDTVVDSSHLQLGDLSIDSQHTVVRGGSQTVYADVFGGYGFNQQSSLSVHDQETVQGNGYFEQHIASYDSHTSDTYAVGVPTYMLSGIQLDDMSLMLGMGGKG